MLLTVLAIVAGVLVVAVAVALLDRRAAAVAERAASDQLSAPFGGPVDVRVLGRPFLLQALRGRYAEVAVSGGGLRVGEMTGATLTARLRNVHLPAALLLGRGPRELVCEDVQGDVVLPYGEIARVSAIPGLELDPVGDRLLASAAVPVAGIGQLVRVNGHAVLSVGDGGVWLRVRGVSVVGIAVPRVVLAQLLPTLQVPIPLPDLPYGLRIDALTPTPDGLVVTGSAQAVVWRAVTEPR